MYVTQSGKHGLHAVLKELLGRKPTAPTYVIGNQFIRLR